MTSEHFVLSRYEVFLDSNFSIVLSAVVRFFLIFFWGFLFFSLRGRPLFLDLFLSLNAGRPLFICFLCGTPRFSGGT